MSKKGTKNEPQNPNEPPELSLLKVERNGKVYEYAVVYINRRPKSFGAYGSKKAEIGYAKFEAEWYAERARRIAGGRNKSPTRPEAVRQPNPIIRPTMNGRNRRKPKQLVWYRAKVATVFQTKTDCGDFS